MLSTSFDRFEIQNGGGNRNGNEFVRSPHGTGLIAADYKILTGDGGKIVLSGDWRYTSKQFYYVDPQSESRHLLNQKGYSIASARVSYSLGDGKHTFTAYGNNLGDTKYKNHTLTSFVPGTVTGDTVIWGQRRTFGVSYTAKF